MEADGLAGPEEMYRLDELEAGDELSERARMLGSTAVQESSHDGEALSVLEGS